MMILGSHIKALAQEMAEHVGLLWEMLPERPDIACGHGQPEGCRSYWYGLARVALVTYKGLTQ